MASPSTATGPSVTRSSAPGIGLRDARRTTAHPRRRRRCRTAASLRAAAARSRQLRRRCGPAAPTPAPPQRRAARRGRRWCARFRGPVAAAVAASAAISWISPMRMRLLGVELVTGEQPPHGVSPAGLAGQSDRGAAERIDAAQHLHLRKPGVRRPRPGCRRPAATRCQASGTSRGRRRRSAWSRCRPAATGHARRRETAIRRPRCSGPTSTRSRPDVKWSPCAKSTPARSVSSDSSSP